MPPACDGDAHVARTRSNCRDGLDPQVLRRVNDDTACGFVGHDVS